VPEGGVDMDWLFKFPQLDSETLLGFKRAIDGALKALTRSYGQSIENFFYPLQRVLILFEQMMIAAPWPLVVLALAAIAWFAARSWKVVVAVIAMLLAIGLFGMWVDAMKTISLVFTATIFSIAIGIPLGIMMNRYRRLGSVLQTVLDVMQTMPPFVYLIPVVMLLGIGRVPGFIAVVIYAIPPIIRLTDLGIRLVDKEVLEAADAYGCSRWQKLWKVQMPLAMPTIMAGINQTIMMALGMVVIASMIGVQGLGLNVLQAIANQYFTQGIFNGFAIVGIAIIFDRISQAYGQRLQKHRGAAHE
jgi:glycine betaine/proline transport system permease protein